MSESESLCREGFGQRDLLEVVNNKYKQDRNKRAVALIERLLNSRHILDQLLTATLCKDVL